MPFIASLLANDGQWASYAVYTTLELYHVNTQPPSHVIQFIYRGKPVQFPYCDEVLCDFGQFMSHLQLLIPNKPDSAAAATGHRRPRRPSQGLLRAEREADDEYWPFKNGNPAVFT